MSEAIAPAIQSLDIGAGYSVPAPIVCLLADPNVELVQEGSTSTRSVTRQKARKLV